MKATSNRRPLRTWEITTGVIALGLVVFGIFLISVNAGGKGSGCNTTGRNHTVHLQDDSFSSVRLTAAQCDTLTITNKDSKAYLLAFGNHDHHQAYPGFTERTLTTNKSFTIDLTKTGTFRLHDHYRDDAFMQVVVTSHQK